MHNFRNRQATEIPTIVVPKILNSRTLSNQRQMEKVWYETEKAHVIKPDVNLPPVRSVFSNEVKQSANFSSFGGIIEPSPVRKMYLANQLELLKAVKQPSTSKSVSFFCFYVIYMFKATFFNRHQKWMNIKSGESTRDYRSNFQLTVI